MADFEINGVAMPRPSSWKTRPRVMTQDAERLIGNGRLIAPYLQIVPETEWVYKRLKAADYDILWNAYIKACAINKSIEHTVKTLDSNTGKSITYTGYTENNFEAALYRIKNGERIYHNVVVTIVGVGGDDSWLTS